MEKATNTQTPIKTHSEKLQQQKTREDDVKMNLNEKIKLQRIKLYCI